MKHIKVGNFLTHYQITMQALFRIVSISSKVSIVLDIILVFKKTDSSSL